MGRNGNEIKAKIRHKKWKDFGNENSSSLVLSQMQSRDSQVPTYEGKVVSVLLGDRPKCLPTPPEVFESNWSLVPNGVFNFFY